MLSTAPLSTMAGGGGLGGGGGSHRTEVDEVVVMATGKAVAVSGQDARELRRGAAPRCSDRFVSFVCGASPFNRRRPLPAPALSHHTHPPPIIHAPQ
jgi:hypothetical protein